MPILRSTLALSCIALPAPTQDPPAQSSNPDPPPSTTEQSGEPIELRTYWDEGLHFESDDKRFSIKLGGRIHLDYSTMNGTGALGSMFSTDPPGKIEDGSEVRRARLTMGGEIYGGMEFQISYDFSTGDAEPINVYMGLTDTPIGTVRAGFLKEPMSLERLTSSNDVTFLERSLPVELMSFRSLGLLVLDHSADERMTWQYGLFSESRPIAGDSIGEGQWAATARVTGLPVYADEGQQLLHLAASASWRRTSDDPVNITQRPETHLAPDLLDTGMLVTDKALLYGFEAAAVLGPLSMQAEYIAAEEASVSGPSAKLWGYYGLVSYFLTGDHRPYETTEGRFTRVRPTKNYSVEDGGGAWEIALRYSTLAFDDVPTGDDALRDWSVGVNWYLNPNSRIMANYVEGNLDSLGGAFRSFGLRFEVAF